jgi:hypothetical protein
MKKLYAIIIIMLVMIIATAAACAPQKYPPPGWWILKHGPELPKYHLDSSVELKAGETKTMDVTLIAGTRSPGMVTYKIWRVKKAEGSCSAQSRWGVPKDWLPMPEGLNVDIEPNMFLAEEPNKTYISTITIKTSSILPQGEYVLALQMNTQLGKTCRWITVDVVL